MHETLRGVEVDGLERSCLDSIRFGASCLDSIRFGASCLNSIRFGAAAPGIEFAEVRLSTCAFEPHRHDTCAIGLTLAGVQTFRYRGERRVAVRGQLHVLHPDETHDGAAGTDAGFGYRIAYVDPALVRDALQDRELPFVADPVQELTPATRVVASMLADIDEPINELRRVEIVAAIAEMVGSLGGARTRRHAIDHAAVERVRSRLAEDPAAATPPGELERLAGHDRFTLARQFRRAFGTSPDRYRTLRRLELARASIERGVPLARAAADAGFADQSHMTRQFKRTYGLTPGRWAKIVDRS